MIKRSLLPLAVVAIAAWSPAQASEFTGFRAGIQVGADRSAYDNEDAGIDESFGGVAAGFSIGYDFGLGENVVMGLEATAEEANTDYDFKDGSDFVEIDAKRDLGLVGRLGVKASERALIYGLIGYSNARVRARGKVSGVSFNEPGNVDGVRVGAGVETVLGRKGYGKIEYRYSDYSDGLSRNQIVLGAGIRF